MRLIIKPFKLTKLFKSTLFKFISKFKSKGSNITELSNRLLLLIFFSDLKFKNFFLNS